MDASSSPSSDPRDAAAANAELDDRVGPDPLNPLAPPGAESLLEPATAKAEPVAARERIASVDVLRGVALLGILAMNIVFFAWPFQAYENPDMIGGGWVNRAPWLLNHAVFSGKMMTLFSMLFGAGLVLMADRAASKGATIAGTYYRRVLILLGIGLVHAYLIWAGDILVWYALTGLVLFLFRRWPPRRLLIVGGIVLVFAPLVFPAMGGGLWFVRHKAGIVEAQLAAGEEPEQWATDFPEMWAEIEGEFRPGPEAFEEQMAVYRDGGYAEIVRARAPQVLMMDTVFFLMMGFWGTGGRMMLGMALMKLRVFSAERSDRFYVRMAAIGYGIGLPMTLLGAFDLLATDFDFVRAKLFGTTITYYATIPMALGHAAAVMLICKAGALPWLTARLAAVGRMALTNYLAQSLICTTLFYGYGLGYFGQLNRLQLWGVVLAVWALQLAYSPPWLARFRFGPAEWLWRCLTYGRLQPIRREPALA